MYYLFLKKNQLVYKCNKLKFKVFESAIFYRLFYLNFYLISTNPIHCYKRLVFIPSHLGNTHRHDTDVAVVVLICFIPHFIHVHFFCSNLLLLLFTTARVLYFVYFYSGMKGPLPTTAGHFWLLVFEQNTRAILMLNRVMEKGMVMYLLSLITFFYMIH